MEERKEDDVTGTTGTDATPAAEPQAGTGDNVGGTASDANAVEETEKTEDEKANDERRAHGLPS